MLKSTKFCRQSLNVYKQACTRLKSTPASVGTTLSSAEMADTEMSTDFQFPFASARVGSFAQEPPQLGNQYSQDSLLRSFLKRHIPAQVMIFPEVVECRTRDSHLER